MRRVAMLVVLGAGTLTAQQQSSSITYPATKKVDTVTIRGWSLDKPSEDGATFELTWNN